MSDLIVKEGTIWRKKDIDSGANDIHNCTVRFTKSTFPMINKNIKGKNTILLATDIAFVHLSSKG